MNCNLPSLGDVKKGADLILSMKYQNNDGSSRSLVSVGIEMDFRASDSGVFLSQTSQGSGITIIDEVQGLYSVDAGNTGAWPVGLVETDIKYTVSGKKSVTDTIMLRIISGVTQ